MDDTEAVAWLGRKIAWGLTPGQAADWNGRGPQGVIDLLMDPDAAGVPLRPDAFADVEIDPESLGDTSRAGILAWMDQAIASARPLETFMEFFWMDYFAVSLRVVRPPWLVFDHVNMLGRHALGNFGDLLRDVTTDAAMLVFLDGAGSTAGSPNENYGRELLELYSVGVGSHTEADVKAAAVALTGWIVNRQDATPAFVSRRHDDTPQTLLGVRDVHDVDTVIAAVLSHPATAEQLVKKLAAAILGPGVDSNLLAGLAEALRVDYEVAPIVRRLLELGIASEATPALVEPFAWYAAALNTTGAAPRIQAAQSYFRTAGQIPLSPPNVGGFPEPDAYLSTSATIARFNMASHLAERGGARAAAEDASDLDVLANRLGLPGGFQPATRAALEGLSGGVDRLAAALASPDLVVA